jgi:hypothetical protein
MRLKEGGQEVLTRKEVAWGEVGRVPESPGGRVSASIPVFEDGIVVAPWYWV